jgi:multiple sugar transport system permease protein
MSGSNSAQQSRTMVAQPAEGSAPPVGAGASRTRRRPVARRQRPLWMLAPGGLLMTVVILIPLMIGVYISLIDLDQYTLRHWISAPFVGLQNYVEAVSETGLLGSIWISVSFAVLATLVTVPIGVAAAVVTQNAYRGRAVVRAVFLIPYVLPSFVVASVWRTMLQLDGIVNVMLGKVGIQPALWLSGPLSFWTLVLGLQAIEGEVHEASALDGASWWKKLRYVIFPYLKGPVALAFLLATLNHINNFTLPFVLFGAPAPADVNVLPMAVYVASFQSFRFGLSAAMAVVSLILIMIPLLIYLRAVRLDVGEEGGQK